MAPWHFGTFVLCFAGLAAIYHRVRAEFPRGVAGLTVTLLFGATSLLWYTLFEPSLTETASFALVAALVTIVRPDAPDRPVVMRLAWAALASVPLVILWRSWPIHFTSRWADVLFSSWHGFLSWTPVVYIAVIGTALYARRSRSRSAAVLLVIAASAWIVGASASWMADPRFAERRLLFLLPLLAPGLAHLVDALQRCPALALAPLVVAPIFWNHLLMVQYTAGMLPKDEPVSFARLVRQQPDAYLRTSRFYPFAFPANVLFAWREGVPVDRYDVLALEPRRQDLDLAMDRKAARFLLEGWDAPGMDGSTPVWWLRGREAVVAVPLALPADKPIEIVVTARSRYEQPVVQSDLTLQINGQPVGDFSPAAAAASDARFLVPSGQTFWRDGINRIAFVSRGTRRVDSSDTRPPGPLARRAGRPAWPVAIYRITIRPL